MIFPDIVLNKRLKMFRSIPTLEANRKWLKYNNYTVLLHCYTDKTSQQKFAIYLFWQWILDETFLILLPWIWIIIQYYLIWNLKHEWGNIYSFTYLVACLLKQIVSLIIFVGGGGEGGGWYYDSVSLHYWGKKNEKLNRV